MNGRGARAVLCALAMSVCASCDDDPSRPADDGIKDQVSGDLADGASRDNAKPGGDGTGHDGPKTDGAKTDGAKTDGAKTDGACAPQTLTFSAVADAYVEQTNPTTNHGSATTLQVDQGPDEQAFVRFTVAGLAGPATQVKLRVYVTNGSTDGPAVYATSSTWTESGLIWNNKPATSGAKLADLGSATSTGWLDIDLGAAVTTSGAVSFVLVPTSTDGFDFSSRESANGPKLVVSACGGGQADGGPKDAKPVDGKPPADLKPPSDLPPAGDGPVAGGFRFISWADTKTRTTELSTISDQAALFMPKFTIYEGDMVDTWSSTAMDAWKKAVGGELTNDATYGTSPNGLFAVTFTVRGNHDASGSSTGYQTWMSTNHPLSTAVTQIGGKSYSYLAGNDNQVYSFDYMNAHFVGLDALGGACSLSSAQVTWLDTDLTAAEARGVQHSFVFFHGPIYCVDGHCSCTTKTCVETCSVLASLITVLNKHATISATFHGHEHLYAHTYLDSTRDSRVTNPFHQFVTGDAGAGPSACDKTYRFDYCMDATSDGKAGFTVVDVQGLKVTVTFYKSGIATAQKVVTYTMP